jgi:hypothetical protein
MDYEFEEQILKRVIVDIGSKGSYSEIEKQQFAKAKEMISPAYQLKIQEERDRVDEQRRAKKLALQPLPMAA